ncbi:hypothetical protein K3N28_05885 [Glycomyces sp. TRM65418]|uniref:hypothetical protein n=1 Tax=Glycomyces sp. TRM65418 TaxID=2867006 RepID=UPI001CE6EA4C|nr:hypothetical protein [Glycomyces sp. TRM65418]MCC3762599.1 hypothetical protein [Glycomyces sp. TRM65418]QZD56637.1 hypothetical protein K3N28_05845 [Glycomyces sp. TRM65418]
MVTRIHIGGLDLEFGDRVRRYRVYAVPEVDAVAVSRVYPDPEHGRDIASASGLDSGRPRFDLPSNWNDTQSSVAVDEIVLLYLAWKARVVEEEHRNASRDWQGPADAQ